MAAQLLKNVIRVGVPRNSAAFSVSPQRLVDIIESKLKIKEAVQVDNQLILAPDEVEHRRKLRGTIIINEPADITAVNGVPAEHARGRRVRIFQSSKNAMQSGTDNVGAWQLEFDTRERWENPLMGWSSSGDPLSNMSVDFLNEKDAVEFAEKNGWDWFLDVPTPIAPKVKSYGYNFSWNKRNRVSTK